MMFGAFLSLMVPFLTSLALAEGLRAEETARLRQLLLEVLAVMAGLALVLTQCRSAWAGGLAGMLVLVVAWRRSDARGRRAAPGGMRGAYLLLTVCVSGALIFRFGAASDALRQRVGTLQRAAHGGDASFNWRVEKWRQALVLIAAHPFAGCGLGSYPFHQSPAAGAGSRPAVVAMVGVSLDEQAHNEYVQMAVEQGIVGLFLYLLVLASFFAKAIRGLRRLPNGQRKLVLLGCMAGVVAQMVDAIGNPAWRYPQCSLFFWLLLGLGAACIRMAYTIPAAPHPAGAWPRDHASLAPSS
jgi:O-antigen ligase